MSISHRQEQRRTERSVDATDCLYPQPGCHLLMPWSRTQGCRSEACSSWAALTGLPGAWLDVLRARAHACGDGVMTNRVVVFSLYT